MSDVKRSGLGWGWSILFVSLIVANVLTLHYLRIARQQLTKEHDFHEATLTRSFLGPWADTGKELQWPILDNLNGASHASDLRRTDDLRSTDSAPRLVLVTSQTSCFADQDVMARLANKLANEYGKQQVRAVVHSDSRQLASSFARVNGLLFPVYYDPTDRFAQLNRISRRPSLLLVDGTGHVLVTMTPTEPSESVEKFEDICRRVLTGASRWATEGNDASEAQLLKGSPTP